MRILSLLSALLLTSSLLAYEFAYRSVDFYPGSDQVRTITVNGVGGAAAGNPETAREAALLDGLASVAEILYGFGLQHQSVMESGILTSDVTSYKISLDAENPCIPGVVLRVQRTLEDGASIGDLVAVKIASIRYSGLLENGLIDAPSAGGGPGSAGRALRSYLEKNRFRIEQEAVRNDVCTIRLIYVPVKALSFGPELAISGPLPTAGTPIPEGFLSDDVLQVSAVGVPPQEGITDAFSKAYVTYHAAVVNGYARVFEKVLDRTVSGKARAGDPSSDVISMQSGLAQGERLEFVRGLRVTAVNTSPDGAYEVGVCLRSRGLKQKLTATK
jgi:hypothetical protein